ncbi:hypothetical protein SEMRO_3036_G342570.1 [Seminavis robusta]|uniref:Uncharacterized protein n=1 Tax=Seminavis robusta TaxID=568900 RepID=A0A9N8F4P8_9STRA|nr:hypothetical protein SEMRO_3036_G342570.1 [Seminavis robusta]|eukprot:Sro3036_g342570.1 n/a (196) ;mRNA; r:5913-6500
MDRMAAPWSPTQPLEDLYNQVKDAQKSAADHDAITDKLAVRAAIKNLANSGVFIDALRYWRKKPIADQESMAIMEAHFTAADKERRQVLTTKEMGYANKAVEKPNTANHIDMANKASEHGDPMYYCWSHGSGPNDKHTSKACTRKLPGHNDAAVQSNMLGGCCVIHRRNGERPIYRKPQRQPRETDENQQPTGPP